MNLSLRKFLMCACGVYFCVQFLCCESPSVCVFSRVVGPPRVMLLSVRSCRPSVETRQETEESMKNT